VLAIGIATQRPWFESFVQEKYTAQYDELPALVQETAEAAAAGEVDREKFKRLPESQRLALYEDWMIRREPDRPRAAKALADVAPRLYLDRAERTVVCGDDDQRHRAMEFLTLCGRPEAAEKLYKLAAWARRRALSNLGDELEAAARRAKAAP
jgi:hypothetical protein